MFKKLKKGEFFLVEHKNIWQGKNPYKMLQGWECSRCWQWNKRYSLCYEVETYRDVYRICENCTKLLGLVW